MEDPHVGLAVSATRSRVTKVLLSADGAELIEGQVMRMREEMGRHRKGDIQ